jgi:hypothetical protein
MNKQVKYRKIYEQHYGSIPVDEQGRSYDVHHINGNPNDNRPENLRAVSIKEHYEIHLSQGDYLAALYLSNRMNLSPEEISHLASEGAKKRIFEGTHHFLSGKIQSEAAKVRVDRGTHNFVGGKSARKRVEDGTHPLLGGEIQRRENAKRLANGTHNFIVEHTCPHCYMTGKGPSMKRWHFENCKERM